MNRPIRLAIISAFPVLPTSAGGKIRIVQLARSLSKLGVEVTIIAPYHLTQTRALADREPFRLCQVPYPPLLLSLFLVDRLFPYGSLISFHPGYGMTLPVSLDSFDIVQFEHPAFVDLAQRVPTSVPIVYGSQNVEFDYVSAESPPGLVRRVAGGRIRTLEARMIKRAKHVFACTTEDRWRFDELYGVSADRVTVIPNGIDLAGVDARQANHSHGATSVSMSLPRRAILVGSDVKHNREAARDILERVAPQFETEIEFAFIGPCARRLRGKHGPNVIIDPTRELAHYARPGAIGLNPIVAGSGSNLKLLYYLAHGLSALSTPFGMRGYQDLIPWVMTADLDGFPAALSGTVEAPNGVRQQLTHYEWSAIAAGALQVYESLLTDA